MGDSPTPTKLWKQHVFTSRGHVELTEVLSNSHPAESVIHRTASLSEDDEWVYDQPDRTDQPQQPGPARRLSAKFIYIPTKTRRNSTELNIANPVFDRVVNDHDLEVAFTSYQTTYAGIFECSPRQETDGQTPKTRSFCFSYHPKLAVIWTVEKTSNTVCAAVLATDKQVKHFSKLLACNYGRSEYCHAMLPGYITAHLLSSEIDSLHHVLKERIRGVEVRTEHHGFESRPEAAAEGNLGELSAMMSGCETKLAATKRKIEVLKDLLDFMEQDCQSGGLNKSGSSPSSEQNGAETFLCNGIRDLRRRLNLRLLDNNYTLERARIQRSAIFSMIGQTDAQFNLRVAEESMMIALHAKRDSAAMRTLAFVTMIFLPGTFVAALFSMPLFDWTGEKGKAVLLPKFHIFWAVALPLTVVTLVTYVSWSHWYAQRNESLVKDDVEAMRSLQARKHELANKLSSTTLREKGD